MKALLPMDMKERLLLVAALLSMIVVYSAFQGSHSSFITHTNPVHGNPKKPSVGYSYYYNGDLMHKENFYPFRQLELIKIGTMDNGLASRPFTDRRFFHAVLTNIFTVILSPPYAFQALNFIIYLLTALLVFRFSEALGRGEALPHRRSASWIATFLYIFSPSAVMFIGDLSPHIYGIFFYFLWSYLLLVKWRESISWKWAIGMSALLGTWAAWYPSAGYGAAIFLLYLLWKRQWLKAALPIGTMFLMPRAQMWVIEVLGGYYGKNTEALYFQNGLLTQWNVLLTRPEIYFYNTSKAFFNFLYVDNPWTISLGLMGLFLLKKKYLPLLLLIIFVPVGIVMPVYTASSARAYIVSGISIALLPLAAHMFLEFFAGIFKGDVSEPERKMYRNRKRALIGGAAILSLIFFLFPIYGIERNRDLIQWGMALIVAPFLLLQIPPIRKIGQSFSAVRWGLFAFAAVIWFSLHFLWGTSPGYRAVVPHFAFTQGIFAPKHPYTFQARYINITGDAEDVPASLGGTGSWADKVQVPEDGKTIPLFPEERISSFEDGTFQTSKVFYRLAIQSLFVVFVGVALFLLVGAPYSGIAIALMLCGVLATTFAGSRYGLEQSYASYFDSNIRLVGANTVLHGTLQLSEEAQEEIRKAALEEGVEYIDLYTHMSKLRRGVSDFQILDNNGALERKDDEFLFQPVGFSHRGSSRLPNVFEIEPKKFIEFLEQNDGRIDYVFTLKGISVSKLNIGSWQRCVPGQREAKIYAIDREEQSLTWCPSFEIRVRHKGRYNVLIGL